MRKSKRAQIRERRKRKDLQFRLIWGGIGLGLTALLAFLLWGALRPATGEAVPVMAESNHIPEGTDPGKYNSDPPTSGPHYANELDAGFYESNSYTYPQGYLVHNLEHGYVIFWYNCDLLSEAACSELKTQIKSVMDDFNNFKLIAYPWPSLNDPVVMTSWGRLQRFETFNPKQAAAFIRANRNHAPEPNAP